MKLYEFEGKELLTEAGIKVPESVLAGNAGEAAKISRFEKAVVKAQTLSGKRAKSGFVKICRHKDIAEEAAKMFDMQHNRETIKKVLVEEKLDIENEFYAGIMFDTHTRTPCLIVSKEGGIDIEETQKKHPEKVFVEEIDAINGLSEHQAEKVLLKLKFKEELIPKLTSLLLTLYETFEKNDMKMIEINPLAELADGELVALDAVVVLDDDALYRQEHKFPPRIGAWRMQTEREMEAHEIDKNDYRGVAGKSYIDLDGDIAVLTSGGGASITCMDALLSYGGKPANYVEYSGNPPPEKVEKITKITLSKPGLCGCWAVGGTANFTRIDLTMQAFIEGLKAVKPDYPIVVRRAGPGDLTAYELLKKAAKEYGFDIHVYGEDTPMTATAKILVDLVKEYKKNKRIK